jgi:ectoine hydroxylase-related dioxygenase (phytanoyl-CoA dioxygenase family)
MDVVRMKADESRVAIVEVLREDGVVVVEGMLSDDLLARFNAELDPILEAARPDPAFINDSVAWFFGDKTRHVTGVAGKSHVFATEILTHPLYLGLADAVLRENCARYQLNLAHVLDRGPGSEQQLLHRDEDIWNYLAKPHPDVQLSSVIALGDFTAENGATVVAPGSHRWDPERQATQHDVVPAVMPAGAAVVYLGSTIHAGGTNVTPSERRRGMHLSYCVGWLRTEENQVLATPIEVARTLPRDAQGLLGYAAHDAIETGGGYLGTVELQDPLELIATGSL